MRAMLVTALLLGFVAALPAEAQTRRLPRKSPAERQVEEINRNLQREQRLKQIEQQSRFETNQLRQSLDRQRMFSSPSPSRPFGTTCRPGLIGC
jgi:uncharacterized protein HemX